MHARGQETDDDALEIVSHRGAAATRFWMGDYAGAHREGDAVHRLYDAERHAGIAAFTNSDPFTGEGVYRSHFLWMLGLPEQALAANAAAEANARLRGHPFDLAFLLTLGAQLYGYLGDWRGLLARADEAVEIGKQRGISLLGEILAEISRGVAWLHAGRAEDAAVQLDAAIGRLMQTGHGVWIGYLRVLQAQALAQTGRLGEAATLMDESLAKMAAGEERAHWAEALRLRGWLAGLQHDDAAAEAYLRHALEVARAQEARGWELRAATDLARRLAGRGECAEGRELLREVYGRFAEGFETPDLRAARQILAEFEDAPAGRRSGGGGEPIEASKTQRIWLGDLDSNQD
jgi:tetratricopeptide (TPR) repeat protein